MSVVEAYHRRSTSYRFAFRGGYWVWWFSAGLCLILRTVAFLRRAVRHDFQDLLLTLVQQAALPPQCKAVEPNDQRA